MPKCVPTNGYLTVFKKTVVYIFWYSLSNNAFDMKKKKNIDDKVIGVFVMQWPECIDVNEEACVARVNCGHPAIFDEMPQRVATHPNAQLDRITWWQRSQTEMDVALTTWPHARLLFRRWDLGLQEVRLMLMLMLLSFSLSLIRKFLLVSLCLSLVVGLFSTSYWLVLLYPSLITIHSFSGMWLKFYLF